MIRIVLENNIRIPVSDILSGHLIFVFNVQIEKFKKQSNAKIGNIVSEILNTHSEMKVVQALEPTMLGKEATRLRLSQELINFITDRLKVQLKDSGIRHDVIAAVIADGDDDLVRIVERAKAVQAFLATEDGANLLAGYKRAANILAIEEKKDGVSYNQPVDATLSAVQPEEGALNTALTQSAASIEADLAAENYTQAMRSLSKLRAPVDQFFDKVLVNAEDKAVRANRLRLLSQLRTTLDKIANFSLVEGDIKEQKKKAA